MNTRLIFAIVSAAAIWISQGRAQVYEKVHGFATDELASDGGVPYSGFVEGVDRALYGTTSEGGSQLGGTVFKIDTDGKVSSLLSFSVELGANPGGLLPVSSLIRGRDGNFYGTTQYGGATQNGTIFKMTPAGVVTTLVEFTLNGTTNRGRYPRAALCEGLDGDFYGTTSSGGAEGLGTVFKMTPSGTLTTLMEFSNTGGEPSNATDSPVGSGLAVGPGGELFGTSTAGGVMGNGTIFKVDRSGVVSVVVSFTGATGSAKGSVPVANLTPGPNGILYGTTSKGGSSDLGTIFVLNPNGSFFSLAEFDGNGSANRGFYPSSAVILGSDGNLYGTTLADC